MGWFYSFKLHAIINSKGELFRLKLTPGNVDDRKPMPELCQELFGQRFADQGTIAGWLTEMLAEQGLQLITTLKKNMKPVPRTGFYKAILRRRSLIETVFDELKYLRQIEHTRHRHHFNFAINLDGGHYGLLPGQQAHVVSDQEGQSLAFSLMAYPELRLCIKQIWINLGL